MGKIVPLFKNQIILSLKKKTREHNEIPSLWSLFQNYYEIFKI